MKTPISKREIQRRQIYAKELGKSVAMLIQSSSELFALINLVIWHGSLPLARGGSRYDVDFAIFARSENPDDLITTCKLLSMRIQETLTNLFWREDVHYDGMPMFEVHTHWDTEDTTLPHVGVHFYEEAAKSELIGECRWRDPEPCESLSFRQMYDAWRRFSFYYRHWIYEGIPVYDPQNFFEKAKSQGYTPAEWFKQYLELVVRSILKEYESSLAGPCSVDESYKMALQFTASFAYILEGAPIGRCVRYKDDLAQFESSEARKLLYCVFHGDLQEAARQLLCQSPMFS